ncbi:hypothetical protein [Methylophaga nitratireducenticrescens]|uniref:hypothetical protein n=1 Tax=Methylophaga nitratireducenticrescens TaxID=754476 RepID=UPI00146E1CEC|nr:hypothetical protein [Methylophaga nitratireducenticrescens]
MTSLSLVAPCKTLVIAWLKLWLLDPEELADVIQMGLATAEVAGRYEVSDNA